MQCNTWWSNCSTPVVLNVKLVLIYNLHDQTLPLTCGLSLFTQLESLGARMVECTVTVTTSSGSNDDGNGNGNGSKAVRARAAEAEIVMIHHVKTPISARSSYTILE